jgi:flavin reductase
VAGRCFGEKGLVRQAGNIGCPICSASAAAWSTLETGAPVLADCAVAFDCCVVDVAPVDIYDVLFCRAVALQRSDRVDNLIYFGRDYHVVPAGLA